ncbi:MAG: glycosyltransferase [Patescibacteria group bacterium]|nr:glycosyltransferase [Patescibacteria group bacterium]
MISIIITAWREPKTVSMLVKDIEEEISGLNEEFEILLTCPDEETKQAGIACDSLGLVKWVQDKQKGKPQALNKAIDKAEGEILILTDGDVIVGKEAIAKLLKGFQNPEVGAVSGRPIPINSRSNIFGFWAHLLTEVGAHEQRMEKYRNGEFLDASGYLMAVRRKLLGLIPGNALADDAVISRMIWARGAKVDYQPEAKVYVKYPNNLKDWLLQKKRSAGGFIQINDLIGSSAGVKSKRFLEEISGIFRVLSYPDNVQEFVWTLELVAVRLYLWLLIFWERKVIHKSFESTWVRIESTK